MHPLAGVSPDDRSDFGGWVVADEVRGRLLRLGFEVLTQQVAAWLGRMSREELPLVERRLLYGRDLEYRLTAHGATMIGNQLGVRSSWMVPR